MAQETVGPWVLFLNLVGYRGLPLSSLKNRQITFYVSFTVCYVFHHPKVEENNE